MSGKITSANGRADSSPKRKNLGLPAGILAAHAAVQERTGPVTADDPARQESQVDRVPAAWSGIVGDVAGFIRRYISMPDATLLAVAAWIVASWLCELFDRFPHCAITSPEKRCGKTRLLQLLTLLCKLALFTSNISIASLFRVIQERKPTLILDEAQALSRRGSETAEVLRELLCAGIDRNSVVIRCVGSAHTVTEFNVYSPKVIAAIGELDEVLNDRCLPIRMERKTDSEEVQAYRSRVVQPQGDELRTAIETWTEANKDAVQQVYDTLEPFTISNDRLAEMLTPLQTVLTVACGADSEELALLRRYADALEQHEQEHARQTPGIRLLHAMREIFGDKPGMFISTEALIHQLVTRDEEGWSTYSRGQAITAEAIARLLRPYGIHSERAREGRTRGYRSIRFGPAWGRYLPGPMPE